MVRCSSWQGVSLRLLSLLFASALVSNSGCKLLSRQQNEYEPPVTVQKEPPKPPPAGTPAARLAMQWQKKVQFGTNPVDQKPMAGLAGRVYLFEKEPSVPLTGDGTIEVALYDDTAGVNATKQIETVRFPADVMPQLLTKDAVGPVYAVNLPWPDYKPVVSQVHFVVTYTPKEGAPISTTSEVITLEHSTATAAAVKPQTQSSVAAK